MKTIRRAAVALILVLVGCLGTYAQGTAASQTELQKKVESYLRHMYAFGPEVKLTVGAPKDSPIPGLMETTIDLSVDDNHQSAVMYISKDGKFLLRGEVSDLSKDELGETRNRIDTRNSPSQGPSSAKVTLVEYADFECPMCRQLHDVMRNILPNYPQVRFIFKDFPIEQIHPWARTAALAGRCAYQQQPQSFWKMYDLLYDGQDLISASNAYDKVLDFAGQSGLDKDAFKACLSSQAASLAVDASVANAKLVEVTSTPTVFVNGRRVVGADQRTIEQYIKYELEHSQPAKSSANN